MSTETVGPGALPSSRGQENSHPKDLDEVKTSNHPFCEEKPTNVNTRSRATCPILNTYQIHRPKNGLRLKVLKYVRVWLIEGMKETCLRVESKRANITQHP